MDAKICPKGKVLVKNKCIRGIQWGFDLTDFGSSVNFEALLKRNQLANYRRKPKQTPLGIHYRYVWENPKVLLVTGNNPITGVYTAPKARHRQKGYASYIGIQGEANTVKKLVKDIKKTVVWSKAESPNERQFI